MTDKWTIERAVMRDDRGDKDRRWILDLEPLPATARHIMSALLSRADAETGEIGVDHAPSLSDLAAMTGLDRSTVRRMLNVLEKKCWIVRNRPDVADARANGTPTWYRLGTPGRDGMPTPVEEDQTTGEVGAQCPQGRGVTPPPKTPKVGARRPQSGGTQPPPVGALCPQGRGTVPPIPLPTPSTTYTDQNHHRASVHETSPNRPTRSSRTATSRPRTGQLPMDVTKPPKAAPSGPRQPDETSQPAAVLTGITDGLVAEFEAGLTIKLDRRSRYDLGRNIDELLADGLTRDQIRNGLILLFQNWGRFGPGMLRRFVQQAAATHNSGNVRPLSRREQSDLAFAQEAAIAAGGDPHDPFAGSLFNTGTVIDGQIVNRETA
jgi:uncharacterized protein YjiS (DUF1127 family)